MTEAVEIFKRRFTPYQDGYLIYPSRKGGGKFITSEEYERLVTDWNRVAGRVGVFKSSAVMIAVIIVWVLLTFALALPAWTHKVFIGVTIGTMMVWLLWASMAPRRLVRDREPVTPPRTAAEARKAGRAALNWRTVIFGLVWSGAIFVSTAVASERTLLAWAWLIGSGLLFCAYLWMVFKKVTDQRS